MCLTHPMPVCLPAQVIMYDEPTAGLDPVASTVVEDLMRSMHDSPDASMNGSSRRSGITSYIVVTHQHSTIRRAVDRLIFLHEVSCKWTCFLAVLPSSQLGPSTLVRTSTPPSCKP